MVGNVTARMSSEEDDDYASSRESVGVKYSTFTEMYLEKPSDVYAGLPAAFVRGAGFRR